MALSIAEDLEMSETDELLAETAALLRDLDVRAVARRLGVCDETVRRLIRDGHLPAYRLRPRGSYRVTRQALARYLDTLHRAS